MVHDLRVKRGLICQNRPNFSSFSCQKDGISTAKVQDFKAGLTLDLSVKKTEENDHKSWLIDNYSLAGSRFPRILLLSTAVLNPMFSLQDRGIFKFCLCVEWRPISSHIEGVRRSFKNQPLYRFDIKSA